MDMKELVQWLNERTKEYDEGNPTVSDKEWDDKFFELVREEERLGFAEKNSPTQKVNWEVVSALNKVKHNHLMLSLDKTLGELVGAAMVSDEDNMLVMGKPNSICFSSTEIPVVGRTGQGNMMIKNSNVVKVVKL